MQRGVIVEQGTTSEVFAAPRHEYTKALFEAAPGRHEGVFCRPRRGGVIPGTARPSTHHDPTRSGAPSLRKYEDHRQRGDAAGPEIF